MVNLKEQEENEDLCKALFLDLPIEIHGRKFTNKLFEKTDAFPVFINHMPYLDSNISTKNFMLLSVLKFCAFTGQQQI